jgi:hypothetical protein
MEIQEFIKVKLVDDTGIEPVTPTMSMSQITVLRRFCYVAVFGFTLKHFQEYQGMTVSVRYLVVSSED